MDKKYVVLTKDKKNKMFLVNEKGYDKIKEAMTIIDEESLVRYVETFSDKEAFTLDMSSNIIPTRIIVDIYEICDIQDY